MLKLWFSVITTVCWWKRFSSVLDINGSLLHPTASVQCPSPTAATATKALVPYIAYRDSWATGYQLTQRHARNETRTCTTWRHARATVTKAGKSWTWCHLANAAIRRTGCLPPIVSAHCIERIGNRWKAPPSAVPAQATSRPISAVLRHYMTMPPGLGSRTLSLRTTTAFTVPLSSTTTSWSMVEGAYSARRLRPNLCCSRAGVRARTAPFTSDALPRASAHTACPSSIAANRCSSFILIRIRCSRNLKRRRSWGMRTPASRTKVSISRARRWPRLPNRLLQQQPWPRLWKIRTSERSRNRSRCPTSTSTASACADSASTTTGRSLLCAPVHLVPCLTYPRGQRGAPLSNRTTTYHRVTPRRLEIPTRRLPSMDCFRAAEEDHRNRTILRTRCDTKNHIIRTSMSLEATRASIVCRRITFPHVRLPPYLTIRLRSSPQAHRRWNRIFIVMLIKIGRYPNQDGSQPQMYFERRYTNLFDYITYLLIRSSFCFHPILSDAHIFLFIGCIFLKVLLVKSVWLEVSFWGKGFWYPC